MARRFMLHLVTEIDFVDGDQTQDALVQNYTQNLRQTVEEAAQNLLLRAVKSTKVETALVAEIIKDDT
jgi:hypothetical protein